MAQAATYLKSTGSPRVAVIGFCQGGSLALCAAQSADVVAAAPFYGLPRGGCDPTKIKIPVQGHWGANDTSSKPEDAEKAFKLMKDAGVNAQLFTDYKDSPHAFMNAIGPKGRELTKGAPRVLS